MTRIDGFVCEHDSSTALNSDRHGSASLFELDDVALSPLHLLHQRKISLPHASIATLNFCCSSAFNFKMSCNDNLANMSPPLLKVTLDQKVSEHTLEPRVILQLVPCAALLFVSRVLLKTIDRPLIFFTNIIVHVQPTIKTPLQLRSVARVKKSFANVTNGQLALRLCSPSVQHACQTQRVHPLQDCFVLFFLLPQLEQG
jgi:hypothetical protein